MIVSTLQNYCQKYYSYNSNIKCVDSIIKCIGFESFHYFINMKVVSSFIIFSDFDYMFQSNYFSIKRIAIRDLLLLLLLLLCHMLIIMSLNTVY